MLLHSTRIRDSAFGYVATVDIALGANVDLGACAKWAVPSVRALLQVLCVQRPNQGLPISRAKATTDLRFVEWLSDTFWTIL